MKLPGPVTLLDGSMGQELINRGAGGNGLLWAAEALFHSPETVQEIHEDYISAGADIICTNSYSTIRNKFEPAGLMHRFNEMNRLAGELAVAARNRSGRRKPSRRNCVPNCWMPSARAVPSRSTSRRKSPSASSPTSSSGS